MQQNNTAKSNCRKMELLADQAERSCAIPTDLDRSKKLFDDGAFGEDLDIVSIVATLWPLGESQVQKWFVDRGFDFHPPISTIGTQNLEHSIFQIMYKQDEVSGIDWNPTWSRQCRGVILFVSEEERVVSVLRYLLQRGEEISTPQQLGDDSANPHQLLLPAEVIANRTGARLRLLDKRQRETIYHLEQGGSIAGELTMKVDGMLAAWTFYSGDMARIMKDVIQSNVESNTFSVALLDACQKSGKKYVAVLSSQKTLLVSDIRTQAYFVTAIVSSMGFRDELYQLLQKNNSLSPAEAIDTFASRIVDRMDGFFIPNGSSSQSICLEAVCGQNNDGRSACAWGVVHDEFALSYQNSFVAVLGRSDGLSSRPHYHFSDRIRSLGFVEPLWWKVSHVNQIQRLLRQLTDVAMGDVTASAFLAANPPMNSTVYENQAEHQALSPEDLLHLEGFVFYAMAGGQPHYNKIKLPLYYILHSGHNETQTREEHVQILAKVGRNNPRISANAKEAADFFGILEEKLKLLCLDLRKDCNLPWEENPFYQALGTEEQSALRRIWENPERRREAWHIMIKHTRIAHEYPLLNSFIRQFPALERTKMKMKVLVKLLRLLVYNMKPWENSYVEKIANMVAPFHPLVLKLYSALKWATKESKNDSKILSYFRVGCPESTDVDVMVRLESSLDVERASRGEIDLRRKLASIAGMPYDLLDINYFYVNTKVGRAQMFSKGTRIMSSNILFCTYDFYDQHFPLPIAKPEPVDIDDMARGLVEFILKDLKQLVGDEAYLKVRSQRLGAYAAKGGSIRRDFVLSVMTHIRDFDSVSSQDAIKSFAVKSIQILSVMYLQKCPFVKDEMAHCCEALYPGYGEHARYHLFRGRQGVRSPTFLPFLTAKIVEAIHSLSSKQPTHWQKIHVNFQKNPSGNLPDNLHAAFWENPLEPTQEFSVLFQSHGGATALQQWFQLDSRNLDALPKDVVTVLDDDQDIALLNDAVGPVVFACSQRSEAWKKIREEFPNSSAGAAPLAMDPDDPAAGFHLFRGCLVEMSVTAAADFSNIPELRGYKLVMVGCIVDSLRTTNQSPDFLLVNKETGRILPGEIKCSPTPFRDNAYLRRTLQQSRRQLQGVADVLGLEGSTCGNHGVLILVNIYNQDGKPSVECRLSLLDCNSNR